MKRFMSLTLLTLSAIFISSTASAWNAAGHMLVAEIAYQQLNPTAKAKVDRLVGYFHGEYPDINTFQQLSVWPDMLRMQRIETFTRWHYINTAFTNDGSPLKNLIDTDNGLWAEQAVEVIVKNENANEYERGRFLAFLAHIVGDLHQPLHTVSLISRNHLDGDKGGNAYSVSINGNRTNLHRLWDSGLGSFQNEMTPNEIKVMASKLMATYPVTAFGNRASDTVPSDWVDEGMTLAKTHVYDTRENASVSDAYMTAGQEKAKAQITLAGYRLGNVLNRLFS